MLHLHLQELWLVEDFLEEEQVEDYLHELELLVLHLHLLEQDSLEEEQVEDYLEVLQEQISLEAHHQKM